LVSVDRAPRRAAISTTSTAGREALHGVGVEGRVRVRNCWKSHVLLALAGQIRYCR